MLALFAAYIQWQRRYGRVWKQYRAKDWEQVAGEFNKGDIVGITAGGGMKGRGQVIGYEIWFDYYYKAEGGRYTLRGRYTLPFFGLFPDKDTAGQCRKRVANKTIIVRVSPRNPKRSCVLDQDVSPSLGKER